MTFRSYYCEGKGSSAVQCLGFRGKEAHGVCVCVCVLPKAVVVLFAALYFVCRFAVCVCSCDVCPEVDH
jgi:hypothetical protein